MIVRTLRPCEVGGRTVRANLPLDLPEQQAQALIDAGDAAPIATPAEVWAADPAPAPAEQE